MTGQPADGQNLNSPVSPDIAGILEAKAHAEHDLAVARQTLLTRTEELEGSLSLLRAVFETAADGIVATDLQGNVTVYNQRFLEMWRLSAHVAEQGVEAMREICVPQLADPAGFLRETSEIYKTSPAESADVLEFSDGRSFDRYSRVQLVDGKPAGRVWTFRDVTRQRHAERQLREQGEWFAVTLASIGDAVVTADTNQRITFMNSVAETLTGYSAAEARGTRVEQVMPLRDERTGHPVRSPVAEALEKGSVVEPAGSTVLARRDGSALPIEDSAAPIRNSAGEIIGAVMVFHDVSERRRRDADLSESQQRFRLLSEVVPQLLWTTSNNGAVEYLNERWYAYTGQTPSEAMPHGWIDAVHPEDRAQTAETWQQAVKTTEPYDIEYRLRSREGYYRWFVARGLPLLGSDGRVIRWYGSCTDIHQQRLTAEALREESLITEKLYELAQALVQELDLEKVVQIITDAGTEMTRAQFGAFFYNVSDANGASYMLYTLSGVPREAFEKFPMPRATHLFGATFHGEGVVRSPDIRKDPRFGKNPPYHGMPDGHLPVTSYLAVPVFTRSGEVIGGLFFGHSDAGVFTERDERIIVGVAAYASAAMESARLYQAAGQARHAAEIANQAKDDFIAALSHELRTPLTPVLAILSSVRDEYDLPAPLAAELHRAEQNVELEARLIDDLLDLTRVTRGKLELRCEPVAAAAAIGDALVVCQPEIDAKQITLCYDAAEFSSLLMADRARLAQVLWNLLKNAVKFTPDGGRITILSRDRAGDAERCVIEVQDNGIGITPENLSRVFEAFEQGGRGVTRQFGGLGLGLAISKAIAEAHGGTLHAESQGPGLGSTFILTLPLLNAAKAAAWRQRPAGGNLPEQASAQNRPLRILLVEDHADSAATLCRVLERHGWKVVHAPAIAQALRLVEDSAETGRFDLVVSDLGLPDGSGLDLMRQLATKHGLRGIALSGYGMDSDLLESKAAGFARHLTKPVAVRELLETIIEVAGDAGGHSSPPLA